MANRNHRRRTRRTKRGKKSHTRRNRRHRGGFSFASITAAAKKHLADAKVSLGKAGAVMKQKVADVRQHPGVQSALGKMSTTLGQAANKISAATEHAGNVARRAVAAVNAKPAQAAGKRRRKRHSKKHHGGRRRGRSVTRRRRVKRGKRSRSRGRRSRSRSRGRRR